MAEAFTPYNVQLAGYNPVAVADALVAVSAFAPFNLKLAVDHTTADGAVLYTVPAGRILEIARAFWQVSVGFTGGSSSAVGLSSSNASYNTAGDILGGASGDLAATLVAGYHGGTLGAKFGTNGVIVLVAGDTIKFNRIASNFTAGSGFAHLQIRPLQ
jgi:hypothetical protein